MVEEQTSKPQQGSWSNIDTDIERRPKVEFVLNKEVIVDFANDFSSPREYPNQTSDGVFYVFDCVSDGEAKVVMTSAWSLLRGLKILEPLAGKTVKIKKIMKDGKQHYQVDLFNDAKAITEKV